MHRAPTAGAAVPPCGVQHAVVRLDSITFACDVSKSKLCAGGTLEWSCTKHCPVGASACQMTIRAAGLTGTIPSAIADLSCASLLTVVYTPGRASNLGVSRTAPIQCDSNVIWVLHFGIVLGEMWCR